jgi:hypothetical protein
MRTAILVVLSAMLLAAASCTKSPPPKPASIAKPLPSLAQALPAQLNTESQKQGLPGSWNGKHAPLAPDVEKVLGVDDYLNLKLEVPQSEYKVVTFVTYNANPMSLIPHVPWVTMTQAGFAVSDVREDEVAIRAVPGKEVTMNVIMMEKGQGSQRQRAMVFHYFNVGGTYTTKREKARLLGMSGSGHPGSFMSQTQVIVWVPPESTEDPLSKDSAAYRLGTEVLNALVPLLEQEYYPDPGKGVKD